MAMKRRMKGGERKTITSLAVLARNDFVQMDGRRMWPTIRATDADRGGRGDLIQAVRGNSNPHFRQYPTPTANRWSGLRSHGVNVVTGALNPTWVEWLMGFPLGWTVCEAWETRSSRRSRNGSEGK